MAKDAASRNDVAGAPLLLDDPDIEFGFADRLSETQRYSFTPGNTDPNSVRITGDLSSGVANRLKGTSVFQRV